MSGEGAEEEPYRPSWRIRLAELAIALLTIAIFLAMGYYRFTHRAAPPEPAPAGVETPAPGR